MVPKKKKKNEKNRCKHIEQYCYWFFADVIIIYKTPYHIGICGQYRLRSLEVNTTVNMAVQIVSILLVIVSSILCSSGTQQGVSSTQAGQTLQIQPNVRKYNKHTVTEKPCTTGSTTTGTRKDKPENYSDVQDYVPIGGGGGSFSGPAAYPYAPYPYQPYQPYQPSVNYPYRLQYPYEPASYPTEAAQVPYYPPPPPAQGPYYAPSLQPAQGPYYAPPPQYYPVPPYYPASPSYHPAAYPAPPQQLYDQSPTVVDAYRSPAQPALPAEQPQYHRQPVPYGPYAPQQPFSPAPPHFRAHAYNNRPSVAATATTIPFLQQRDAAAGTATATSTAEPSQQYDLAQQQPGSYDGGNQYHY